MSYIEQMQGPMTPEQSMYRQRRDMTQSYLNNMGGGGDRAQLEEELRQLTGQLYSTTPAGATMDSGPGMNAIGERIAQLRALLGIPVK